MSQIITDQEQHVLTTAQANLTVVLDQVRSMNNDLFDPITDDLDDANKAIKEILESV